MEIEGMIIHDLGETGGTSKAGNVWKKHEWVLETQGNFPRKVKFHVFGEKCTTMTFVPGKMYALQFDLESREFNGRWYTDVSVYNSRPLEGGEIQQGPQMSQQPVPTNPFTQTPAAPAQNYTAPAPDFSQSGDPQEDLPF